MKKIMTRHETPERGTFCSFHIIGTGQDQLIHGHMDEWSDDFIEGLGLNGKRFPISTVDRVEVHKLKSVGVTIETLPQN